LIGCCFFFLHSSLLLMVSGHLTSKIVLRQRFRKNWSALIEDAVSLHVSEGSRSNRPQTKSAPDQIIVLLNGFFYLMCFTLFFHTGKSHVRHFCCLLLSTCQVKYFLNSSEHRNRNKPFYIYKGLIQWQGKSSVLPMTNVHAWEQCHSYTEVIKGRCLKDI
jgi:hypothetical protein